VDRRTFGGAHELERLRLKQLAVAHSHPRPVQIADGAAIPEIVVEGHVILFRRDPAAAIASIPVRQTFREGEIVAIRRRLHAGRRENVLPHVLREALAADRSTIVTRNAKPIDKSHFVPGSFTHGTPAKRPSSSSALGCRLVPSIVAEVVVVDDAGGVLIGSWRT
jgi:hypothetical protein